MIFFGGAFDPIHEGHIAMAQRALDLINPDVLYFVPLAQAVHKRQPLLTTEQRVALLKKAIADIPRAQIYMKEIERGSKSYTIDTLEEFLAKQAQEIDLYFMMGSDEYLNFWKWKEPFRILSLCKIIVFSREGFCSDCHRPPLELEDKFIFVDDFQNEASSTKIRQSL